MEEEKAKAAGPKVAVGDFFRHKNVFISGASGFLGKVVLHKVLSTSRDIGHVYLLLRTKKGSTPEERLDSVLKTVIFDELRRTDPGRLERVHCVAGDITLPGLGLGPEDVETLRANVNVCLHCAADVNFDNKLSKAYTMNVMGTRSMLDLAKTMANLHVFVHVSTAYSYCTRKFIDDKLFSDPLLNDHTLEKFQEMEKDPNFNKKAFIGTWPNTYCFTKAVAEQAIHEYKHSFPIAVVRPSIILGAVRDPVPGWIEGLNGANGLLAGGGTGFFASVFGRPDVKADLIPVDTVSNMICAVAAARAHAAKLGDEEGEEVPVYNCTSGGQAPVNWGELSHICMHWFHVHPLESPLWVPGVNIQDNRLAHYAHCMFRTWIPSLIGDVGRRMIGMKPRFVRLCNRFYQVENAFDLFLNHEWDWSNERTFKLIDNMTEEERVIYE